VGPRTFLPCGLREIKDYGRLRGAFNLLVISVGVDAQLIRRASSDIEMEDTIIVRTDSPTTLEFTFGIGGSLTAAESFGDPTLTYAKGRLSLEGSMGPATISRRVVEVESVSVIPAIEEIDEFITIEIDVPAGEMRLPMRLTGVAEAEVSAKCGGLFCLLTGSSTIVVDYDMFAGVVRGPGGGPLPDGVRVTTEGGSDYPTGRPATPRPGDVNGDGVTNVDDRLAIVSILGVAFGDPTYNPDADLDASGLIDQADVDLWDRLHGCPADLDGDGELTIFDFLAFQNAFDVMDPIADFDGDGAFTIFDFLAFQNAFDAGCP
jgi:hypothetical protein